VSQASLSRLYQREGGSKKRSRNRKNLKKLYFGRVMLCDCLRPQNSEFWGFIGFNSFLTSALEGGLLSPSRPSRFYPRERPGTHCTGGWVGPGAGLDRCGKSRPVGIRSPNLPARSESLYRLSYRGSSHTGQLKYTLCEK
jgi:hypothetical protein